MNPLDSHKLASEQIESIRKGLFRNRIILTLILLSLMIPFLLGVNNGVNSTQSSFAAAIILNAVVVGIFGAIWYYGYRNHKKILKGLPTETYTMFEGRVEKASSGGGTVMFQINGMKHYAPYRFGKYCIKGNRVRIYKTDKSGIVFQVEDI